MSPDLYSTLVDMLYTLMLRIVTSTIQKKRHKESQLPISLLSGPIQMGTNIMGAVLSVLYAARNGLMDCEVRRNGRQLHTYNSDTVVS